MGWSETSGEMLGPQQLIIFIYQMMANQNMIAWNMPILEQYREIWSVFPKGEMLPSV